MINKELLKSIKLIILDLDGTILDSNGEVSKNILKAIHSLQEKGLLFSIATGRLFSSVKHFAELLKINLPIITLDGTLIKYSDDHENIYESFLPEKYVNRALELADKYFLKIALILNVLLQILYRV